MSNITVYGIKNCDTMKKAMKWLDNHGIEYDFHDYKKSGVESSTISQWLTQHPWDILINKRGTTWRKLAEEDKEGVDDAKAIELMTANTSLIKRPVLDIDGKLYLGFKDAEYEEIFS